MWCRKCKALTKKNNLQVSEVPFMLSKIEHHPLPPYWLLKTSIYIKKQEGRTIPLSLEHVVCHTQYRAKYSLLLKRVFQSVDFHSTTSTRLWPTAVLNVCNLRWVSQNIPLMWCMKELTMRYLKPSSTFVFKWLIKKFFSGRPNLDLFTQSQHFHEESCKQISFIGLLGSSVLCISIT